MHKLILTTVLLNHLAVKSEMWTERSTFSSEFLAFPLDIGIRLCIYTYDHLTQSHIYLKHEKYLIMLNHSKLNKVAYSIVIITPKWHVYFTDVNVSIFLVYNYSNWRCDLIFLTSVQEGGFYVTHLVNPSSMTHVNIAFFA